MSYKSSQDNLLAVSSLLMLVCLQQLIQHLTRISQLLMRQVQVSLVKTQDKLLARMLQNK
jgi:hypothetical protein